MADTKIAWTEKVWNPVTGCTKTSEGCKNCYAEGLFKRFGKKWGYGFGEIAYHEYRLEDPLYWKKPKKIFVCSMGDLFHEDVKDLYIWEVLKVAISVKRHTFLILTKRPEIMKDVLSRFYWWNSETNRNIWIGISAENQKQMYKRVPTLLDFPAAKRFVSIEPILGPIEISKWVGAVFPKIAPPEHGINWVIVGAESGPNRRPCKIEWVRSIVKQCKAAGVPVFVKQLHIDGKVSTDPEEWPEDLRIQEVPE